MTNKKVFIGVQREDNTELIVLPQANISLFEKSIMSNSSFVTISAYGMKTMTGEHTIVYDTAAMNDEGRLRLIGEFFNWGEIESLSEYVIETKKEKIEEVYDFLKYHDTEVIKQAIKKRGL